MNTRGPGLIPSCHARRCSGRFHSTSLGRAARACALNSIWLILHSSCIGGEQCMHVHPCIQLHPARPAQCASAARLGGSHLRAELCEGRGHAGRMSGFGGLAQADLESEHASLRPLERNRTGCGELAGLASSRACTAPAMPGGSWAGIRSGGGPDGEPPATQPEPWPATSVIAQTQSAQLPVPPHDASVLLSAGVR